MIQNATKIKDKIIFCAGKYFQNNIIDLKILMDFSKNIANNAFLVNDVNKINYIYEFFKNFAVKRKKDYLDVFEVSAFDIKKILSRFQNKEREELKSELLTKKYDLKLITDNSKEILNGFLFEFKTMQEIAKEHNITRQRVSNIIHYCFVKFRREA